jgi:hypothetical protein
MVALVQHAVQLQQQQHDELGANLLCNAWCSAGFGLQLLHLLLFCRE